MITYLTALCLATLSAAVSDVLACERRSTSTTQQHYSVSRADWRKGLFYGLDDVLYSIRFHNHRLSVHALKEGKIDRTWFFDLNDAPGLLRMTAATSDSHDRLFVLFSGNKELIASLSLENSRENMRLDFFSVHGFAQVICYVVGWDAIIVIGQNSSVLLHNDGTVSPFGPEIFYGSTCCPFTTAAAKENTVALNADLGLRLYTKDEEEIIWRQSQSASGFIREVASAGEAWAAIESGISSESSAIRIFLPQEHRFVSSLIPLPKADDSLCKADASWRITDNGHHAIVWSRCSDHLFRVSDKVVESFRLEDTIQRGRVCPASSDRVFLIDSKGYTIISFD